MNTLSFSFRIAVPILFMLLWSCKKEEEQSLKTGEELLRITKVERIDQSFRGHPFYDHPGVVVYEYDGNSNLKGIDIKCYAAQGINCFQSTLNTIVYYSVDKSGNKYQFIMSDDRLRPHNYYYLDTLRVSLSDGFITAAKQSWAPRRMGIITIPLANFKTAANVLALNLKIGTSMKSEEFKVDSEGANPLGRDYFYTQNIVEQYAENQLISIRRQFIDAEGELAFKATHLGIAEYDLLESYELVETSADLPPALVRMVNNALLTFVPLGLETSPNAVTREIEGFNMVGVFPAPFNQAIFQDWIFKLGMIDLDLLKSDGNYIIGSKRTTGRKVVGATGTWPDVLVPVYQDVDSTATYPYTHDPVAKTLEIAGLKIWYEIVE